MIQTGKVTQGKTSTSRMNPSQGRREANLASTLTTAPEAALHVTHENSRLTTHREARESTYTHRQVGLCSLRLTPIPHLQTLPLQVASCRIRKHCFQTYAHILMPTETTSLRDYKVTADKDTETKQQ